MCGNSHTVDGHQLVDIGFNNGRPIYIPYVTAPVWEHFVEAADDKG